MGWMVANARPFSRRQRIAITFASVIPDIDGVGIVADLLTKDSSHATDYYAQWHHVAGHNLFFALLVAFVCIVISKEHRAMSGILGFLSFNLHILGDLCGSKGPDGSQWDIVYLWPVSQVLALKVNWQWELNAWPNLLITVILLVATFYLGWKRGFSLVDVFSHRADRAFVDTLRHRFGNPS
jgi:inner membrane protein